jgi:large subunit ribosomal protein L23
MDIYQVIKKPLITEKGTRQKEGYNQISLRVDRRANKVEIRHAVEQLFKTKVLK